MSEIFSIASDGLNKDVPSNMSLREAREYYLDLHRSGKAFRSKLPKVPVENHLGRMVVRCDLSGLGFKAIAAEKLISNIKEKVLVYCAPRAGHAPLAIAELAAMYGKKAVFFAPASKQPSLHQVCTIALGADLRFVKIAAMPVLNLYAKHWAEKHGAKFLAFGLSGIPEVTAGIVDFGDRLAQECGMPKEFWCATSTGTMIRGLQIAWPKAAAKSIAVARNIHPGEIGAAHVSSATIPFLKECKVQPPFPTTAAYDAKAWEPCLNEGRKNSWFINVGSDAKIYELAKTVDISKIDSVRTWSDMRDLERGL